MIADSLDTLYLMGLKDEFKQGVEYIDPHVQDPSKPLALIQKGSNYLTDTEIFKRSSKHGSFFELNIRVTGGLLGAHSLLAADLQPDVKARARH